MKRLFTIAVAATFAVSAAGCTPEETKQIATQIGNAAFDAACANLSTADLAFQNAVAAGKITSKASMIAERDAVITVSTACNNRPLTSANAMQAALAAVSKIAVAEIAANK